MTARQWDNLLMMILLTMLITECTWLYALNQQANLAQSELFHLEMRVAAAITVDDSTVLSLWHRLPTNRLKHENTLANLEASLLVLRDTNAVAPTPQQIRAVAQVVRRFLPSCSEIDRTDASLVSLLNDGLPNLFTPAQHAYLHANQKQTQQNRRALLNLTKPFDNVCRDLLQYWRDRAVSQ